MTSEEAPQPASARLRTSLRIAAAAVALVAATAAAYWNSFSGPFVFDDLAAIQDNESIRSLHSVAVLIPPGKVTVARRPLTNLSLAVNYAIGGLDVRSYHIGNLLIHLLAALTLFGVVRRTLLLPPLRGRFGGASTGLAAAVALIWALHPLQTESVTYIVQRAESLMGLCFLLTLYALIRAATAKADSENAMADAETRRRGDAEKRLPLSPHVSASPRLRVSVSSFSPRLRVCLWETAAVAACALGMGAKEVMAAAPVVMLLYDRAFLSGSFREAFRRRGALHLGLAATWAVLGAIMLLLPGPAGAGFGIKTVTPWRYALTEPGVILHYLALSFRPQPLCLDCAWPFATEFRQFAPQTLALAALLAATVWAAVRRPALGFPGAWFFLILAPTSSFMPINDACFEHRMYLPLAAVAACAVIGAWMLLRRLALRSALPDRSAAVAAVVLALAAAAALGCAASRRNRDYRTALSLWEATVRAQPQNARAQSSLGSTYFSLGRFDEAMNCFNLAIELKSDSADAYYNRALALIRINDHAGAIRDLDRYISLKPDFADAYLNRGGENSKINHLDEAIRDYGKFIEMKPDSAVGCFNRATVEARARRPGEAIADFGKAIELKRDYAEAYYNRGLAYAGIKRFSDAIHDCADAIALKPDYAAAFVSRANACAALGRYDAALPDLSRAIELDPGNAQVRNMRAVIYFRLKEYDKAWQDVAACRKLGGRPHPDFLKALQQASGRSE